MYQSPKHLLKKKPQPSPLKKEQMKRDLGFDDFELSFSSETSSDEEDNSYVTKELNELNDTRSDVYMKNVELQKEIKILKEKLDKEVRSKKARIRMVQKACSDTIEDKKNLILDLQEMLEERFDSCEVKPLVSRCISLQDDKASLHKQLINAQIEFEQRIHEEIFAKCQFCKNREVKDKVDNEEMELLNRRIANLNDLIEDKEKCLMDAKKSLSDTLHIKQVESSKLKKELSVKEQENQKLNDRIKTTTEELESQKKRFAEERNTEKAFLEQSEKQINELKEEKLCLKKRVEQLTDEMSEEVRKSEKRYNLLQTSYEEEKVKSSEENSKLSDLLQKEQERYWGLKKDHDGTTEKLATDYERANNTINELKELIAAQERESEEKLKLTKLELEKRVQAADEEYEEMKAKYERLQRSSCENVNDISQQVDVVRKESLEKLATQQNGIEKLQLRLASSEEKLSKVMKIAEVSFEELKDKKAEIVDLVGSIRETNEKFVQQSEQIENLQSENASKKKMIADLHDQVEHLKQESETRQTKMNKLEGDLRKSLDEKSEENYFLQERLKSVENSLRLSIEEQDKLNKSLMDRDTQLKTMTEELEEARKASEMQIAKLKESAREKVDKIKHTTNEQISKLQHQCQGLQQQLADQTFLLRQVVPKLTNKLKEVKVDMKEIKSEVEQIPENTVQYSKESIQQIKRQLNFKDEMYRKILYRYRKEMQIRKKLHNELIELRGNIRVFVRVRPPLHEDVESSPTVVSYDANDDSIVYVSNHRGKNLKYEVDKVFTPNATQEELYKEVKSLVTSCMDGYNICIFAYGQTGSGKTYTMEGTATNPGINQRALMDLFSIIEQSSGQWQHEVTVSLLEIYNESLRDLLSSSSEKLDIRMNPDGTLKVSQLVARDVKNLKDVNELFDVGRKNRATACTNMNEHSSRSHAVLVINVVGTSKTDEKKVYGRLNLIDLAGSERVSKSGASGDRLKEAQNINRSLSALGDVIQALRNKQAHVPFRNSKLTYLLQDSLSNDSKTLMVVQVSPNVMSTSETICSLSFAQRVRAIELGMANKKSSTNK